MIMQNHLIGSEVPTRVEVSLIAVFGALSTPLLTDGPYQVRSS